VLSKAEQDKVSVDQFWQNTYNPGIQAWETEKRSLAERLARAESKAAAAERSAAVYSEFGVSDNNGQSRNSAGQYQTPGTPTLIDPNEFIGRAAQGFNQILDISHRHQLLYGKPMEIAPSALISEADRLGISPAEMAERKFSFSKREAELQTQRAKQEEARIREDERSKVLSQYSDSTSGFADPLRGANGGMSAIRKAQERGEVKDPTRLSPQERRQQALASIHKAVEERQQRDI
jgi:hypothetical protein